MTRKFSALIGVISILFLPALAQTSPPTSLPEIIMTNAASRAGQDLSGAWSYSIDPYRDGLYGFHGSPSGRGHQRFDSVDVDRARRDDPSSLFEYDMARSPTTTLPGSWIGHSEALRHYEGLMWYSREVDLQPQADKRYFLRIGASNYLTRLYVNGDLIGTHEGGFTPFTFEITGKTGPGINNITIGVDSQRNDQSVPPPVTDWETYGGVTRPIQLIETPLTFIDDAWVRLTRDGYIAANVQLNGAQQANQEVTITVADRAITLTGSTDASGAFITSTPAPGLLRLWSPDTPYLYDVRISIDGDTLDERIGFRTIEVQGEDILLNGEPIFLRGISMHEEELGLNPARVMTQAAARAQLTEIKSGLNGNFVRLAHYPHSETTLRLADELGLLVWSEIPVYWRIDWDNPDTLTAARNMLTENIRRDRNRASIILWSVANETPISDDRNTFLKRLIDDVRELDNTRLVTAALLTEGRDDNGTLKFRISDPLVEHLDVMSVNTYNGWYGPVPLQDVHKIEWPDEYDKPMIFSEYGAGATAGFYDPDLMRKFSEEYQAEYYRQTLAMSENISFLRGMSPWILKDFRSPRRQDPILQQGWNRKGLISETGKRKQAFDVLSDHYRDMRDAAD